jgi:hypothetical protein
MNQECYPNNKEEKAADKFAQNFITSNSNYILFASKRVSFDAVSCFGAMAC